MKLKNLSISIVTLAVLSGLLVTTAAAVTFPSLPGTPVTMTVTDDGSVSYFVITLSNVPAGYDVLNGDYPGWCLDRGHNMSRSTLLNVTLYSSLNPPVSLNTKPWNQINYILNNKQGTVNDIQLAIWNLMGWWNYAGLTPTAKLLVDEANAHSDFVPAFGQKVAVICLPADTNEQLSLIEVVPAQEPGLGKVTGGGQCIVGDNKKIPSASFGFNAMWFSRNPTPNGEINYVDHITGQHVHVHDLTYLEVWFDEPGNKPWPLMKAKFGGIDVYSGLMVDVYVEDHGEPGKNDIFYIKLDGVYLGGSLVDPILAGNIQIHKPPK